MTEWMGLSGSPGCATGQVVVLQTEEVRPPKEAGGSLAAEADKLRQARTRYLLHLEQLNQKAEADKDKDGADILAAYQEIAADDVFFGTVESLLFSENASAAWALNRMRRDILSSFSGLEDEYMRQRGDDVDNVCRALIYEIQGKEYSRRHAFPEGGEVIVLATELTPVETMQMDKTRLRGIATEKGGPTSHTVILAKNLGIPAVVGIRGLLGQASNGEMALLDGDRGQLVLSPDPQQIQQFGERLLHHKERDELYLIAGQKTAQTLDGREVCVCINADSKVENTGFDFTSCDGVGLYRTEFLYIGRQAAPGEDEQYGAYRQAVEQAQGKEITIRTMDIGGDKPAPYLHLSEEANPFLGYRAIRICLARETLFITQIRAILRASAHGPVRLMFPMIVTLEELLAARAVLEKAKNQLKEEGIAYDTDIGVGIMVETPAAVLLCDRLAPHVNFFSIGTNDLTQYTTATDRMNEQVQYLFDPCNISVLRSVQMVCEAAQRCGVRIAICGESASDPLLIPLWVGLGVTELSVSPALVGRTKYIISHLSGLKMQREAQHILASFGEIEKVRRQLEEIIRPLGL